jgi:predicted RND superfamily exporter protein
MQPFGAARASRIEGTFAKLYESARRTGGDAARVQAARIRSRTAALANPSPGGRVKRGIIERLGDDFERIGARSFDHRWVVGVLCLCVLLGFAALASGTRFDNSFESFFDAGDPTYDAFNRYREDFGSDEVSYILYAAPDSPHGPWSLEVMRQIGQLTAALEEEVPFVDEVTSLANVEFMQPSSDGIEVFELLEDFPDDQAGLLAIRERVLAKALYVGGVVSESGEHASIVISMDKSSVDPVEEIRLDPEGGDGLQNLYPQVSYAKIEEILARPEYAGIVFHHSGDVPINAVYNSLVAEESVVLMGMTFLVVSGVLLLFFRRAVGVLGPIVVVALSLVITVGVIGALGWNLDMMFAMMPTLLIAVGVADAVHIISDFRIQWLATGERREAIRRTLRLVGPPCLLTSITTAVGFASMSVAPIKTLSQLAIYAAIGVLAAFLLSVTLLVVVLSFGRRSPRPGTAIRERALAKGGMRLERSLTAIARFTLRQRVPIVFFFAALLIVSLVGATRISVDSNFLLDLSEEVPVRNTTLYVDEVMGGTMSLIYLFDTGESEGILEPAVLREIERLQARADLETEVVRKTHSIVDLLKDINQTFHEDDPVYFRLPETRELVAQYLLVYELSGGDELDEYLSSDRARASLALRSRWVASSQIDEMASNLDAYLADAPVEHAQLSRTGIGALWMQLMTYITQSQIRGFAVALVVIATLMCILFGSVRVGLIAMLPNLTPVILTLGAMGWLGVPLSYTTVLIAPVAIGLAVDDTMHLLTRFRHEFAERGEYAPAFEAAMRDVGRALVITSVVLVCGFLVNTSSQHTPQVAFGVLLASTIIAALLADFLLLPALIVMTKPFGPERARAVPEAFRESLETETPRAVND